MSTSVRGAPSHGGQVGAKHDIVCELGRRWSTPDEEATCGVWLRGRTGRIVRLWCGRVGCSWPDCNELGAATTRRNGEDLGFHLDLIFGQKTWSCAREKWRGIKNRISRHTICHRHHV
jgi:hypothetical protein